MMDELGHAITVDRGDRVIDRIQHVIDQRPQLLCLRPICIAQPKTQLGWHLTRRVPIDAEIWQVGVEQELSGRAQHAVFRQDEAALAQRAARLLVGPDRGGAIENPRIESLSPTGVAEARVVGGPDRLVTGRVDLDDDLPQRDAGEHTGRSRRDEGRPHGIREALVQR